MPATADNQVKRRGPGRPSLGHGPSDMVGVRMSKQQRQQLEKAAAVEKVRISEFMRTSTLERIFTVMEIERQRDEQRKAHAGRRTAK